MILNSVRHERLIELTVMFIFPPLLSVTIFSGGKFHPKTTISLYTDQKLYSLYISGLYLRKITFFYSQTFFNI